MLTASKFASELEYLRQEGYDCESYEDFGKRFGMSGEGIRLICKGKRSPPQSMLDIFGLEKFVAYRRISPASPPIPQERQ